MVDEVVLELEEPESFFTGTIKLTPPKMPKAHLVKTTLTFLTPTPIALEMCARQAIDDADIEKIWLDTEFDDLVIE
tara:strand:- start:1298 stop:1525 length:228 start_codon:yes stop_codon:yes gene_type:complete